MSKVRRVFLTKAREGMMDAYISMHDNIYPEVCAGLRKSGISSLEIFQSDDDTLIMIIETDGDIDLGIATGPGSKYRENARCKEWEELMDSKYHHGWSEVTSVHSSSVHWNRALKLSSSSKISSTKQTPTSWISSLSNYTTGQVAKAPSSILRTLREKGLSALDATKKLKMFANAAKKIVGTDATRPCSLFYVPGRIEMCGKHTDYAGGRSLLCATTKGFCIASSPRDDAEVHIHTTFGMEQKKETAKLSLSTQAMPPHQGHWTTYPAAAIRRLCSNFEGLEFGVDISIECDLPESSGMSSSSAVICYMFMVLAKRNDLTSHPTFLKYLAANPCDLYTYLGFIENGQSFSETALKGDKGVGTFGGSEDHTAIMSSESRKLKLYSYCPTRHLRTVPWPKDLVLVVCVSGAKAEKTGGAMKDYNNAAFLSFAAARGLVKRGFSANKTFVKGRPNLAEIVQSELVKTYDGKNDTSSLGPCFKSLCEELSKVDDGKTIRILDEKSDFCPAGSLVRRFTQFFYESEYIVPELADAFAKDDRKKIGAFLEDSHERTVNELLNTIPETAWLPREAISLGAIGATAFGAGFGGSCYAVVERSESAAFLKKWSDSYHKKFPKWVKTSSFFECVPGPGAFELA